MPTSILGHLQWRPGAAHPELHRPIAERVGLFGGAWRDSACGNLGAACENVRVSDQGVLRIDVLHRLKGLPSQRGRLGRRGESVTPEYHATVARYPEATPNIRPRGHGLSSFCLRQTHNSSVTSVWRSVRVFHKCQKISCVKNLPQRLRGAKRPKHRQTQATKSSAHIHKEVAQPQGKYKCCDCNCT